MKFPEKIPAICQPPLREIKSDIPLLVQHFISKIRKSTSIQASAEAEMEKCEVIFERTLSVNAQMVHLYWGIGNEILLRQKSEGWGAKIIERLSTDLRKSFPEMKGLSSRNLKYMRRFAEIYPDSEFVQQVAAQIPWFHNCILIDKVKGAGKREWYIQ